MPETGCSQRSIRIQVVSVILICAVITTVVIVAEVAMWLRAWRPPTISHSVGPVGSGAILELGEGGLLRGPLVLHNNKGDVVWSIGPGGTVSRSPEEQKPESHR